MVSGVAVAVLMLGTVAVGVTHAQQPAPRANRMAGQRGAMRAPGSGARMLGPMGAVRFGLGQLGLTDEQKGKVRGIMATHRTEIRALADRAVPARRELADAIAGGDEATVRQRSAGLAAVEADQALLAARIRGEIVQVLTPEQRQKAQALREQRQQRMDQRRGRQVGGR
jgi:Spy/CpxP family protein refolding chaperone